MTKTAKYTDAEHTSILWNDNGKEMTVPNNMGNRHHREIQEWVDEGGSIDPYVAPPVLPLREGSFRDFMKMFTEAEQLAIVLATMVNPEVKLWYDTAMGGVEMSLDHPDTSTGLAALVDASLLTQARMDEIINDGDFNAI